MRNDYEQSYLGQLRKLTGNRKLITPGVRAVIRNDNGDVLLIKRRDNGRWGMPAGSLELDESVFDCLIREVKEETGLVVVSPQLFAVYSEPRFHFTNAFGGEHQMLAFVFLVENWSGNIETQTDETTNAKFFALAALPEIHEIYHETLEDMQRFDGRIILK